MGRGEGGGGWLRIYLSEKPSGNFRFVTLPLEFPEKKTFTPENTAKLYALWNSKARNQDPLKFHLSFSSTPLEISPLFNWLLEYPHVSLIPLEILWFFSGIVPCWVLFEQLQIFTYSQFLNKNCQKCRLHCFHVLHSWDFYPFKSFKTSRFCCENSLDSLQRDIYDPII